MNRMSDADLEQFRADMRGLASEQLAFSEICNLRRELAECRKALEECTCEECGHTPSFKPAVCNCNSASHDPYRDAT